MLQLGHLNQKTKRASAGGFPLLRLRSTLVAAAFASLVSSALLLTGCEQPREDWRSGESAYHVAYYEDCIPQSEEQRERTRISLLVLEKDAATSEMYRGAALGFMKSDTHLCHDEDIDRKAAKLLVESGFFPRWIKDPRMLSVAHRLAKHDDRIVGMLERIAFAPKPIENETSTDIRPRARSILASLGSAIASKWKDRAIREMGSDDALGTGAAQIAAASAEPDAVAAVAKLLEDELPPDPGTVLRLPENQRIIELAYALGAAREAATPYLPLLQRLLTMKVEVNTQTVGKVEVTPSEVCRAYSRIGREGKALAALPPCNSKYDWSILPS